MFENTQELAENKLLLLYIFDKLQCPISNARITEIVLENNLLNYFHLQQYLGELASSGFLNLSKEEKKQYYSLSSKGKSVLEYFENRIANAKKQIILSYLSSHDELVSKYTEVTAEYIPVNDNKFVVNFKITENGTNLIDIKFNVDSIEQAKKICSKWRSNGLQIYSKIQNLFMD